MYIYIYNTLEQGGGVIVVLAKNDKEAMEAELEAAIDAKEGGLQLKGTEVISFCSRLL
jgi:hypothetical protein